MNEHKLAEALGFKRCLKGQDPGPGNRRRPWANHQGVAYSDKELEAYLASPEGRESVRDKVWELCREQEDITHIGYEWNKEQEFLDMPAHAVMLYHADGYRSKAQNTEAEAFAAALIWLAESVPPPNSSCGWLREGDRCSG